MLRIVQYERDRNVAGLIQELGTSIQGRTSYGIPRADAASALGRLGDARAIPHLLELRNDPEWAVRMDAFGALGLLKAKEAVATLVDGLNDPHRGPRMAAAEALGRIGDPTVIPRLREVVHSDANGEVRLHSVEALLLLGDLEARDQVAPALRGVSWRLRTNPRWKRLATFAETGGHLEPWFSPGELR